MIQPMDIDEMGSSAKSTIPTFNIELEDISATDRWREVCFHFKTELLDLEQMIIEKFVQYKLPVKLVNYLARIPLLTYGDELKGISHHSGVSLGLLTAANLLYEMCACCTSIAFHNDH